MIAPIQSAPISSSAVDGVDKKRDLEIQKLQLDIRETAARLRSDEERRQSEKTALTSFRSNWLPSVISLATMAATLLAAWIAASTYFEQQSRQYQFELKHDMIVLVNQLGSTNEFERKVAPQLLSAYERDAVPFLLSNLATGNDPQSTIEALYLVASKHDGRLAAGVKEALLQQATNEFKTAALTDENSVFAVRNFLRAVGKLTMREDSPSPTGGIDLLLRRLRQEQLGQTHHSFYLILTGEADAACQTLIGTPCPET